MKWAAILVAAAVVVAAGVLYFRSGGQSFDTTFRENCLSAARRATDAKGATGPDVAAAQRRMCDCALDLLKAMPADDQRALETSEEKRQAFSAEVQRRCQ